MIQLLSLPAKIIMHYKKLGFDGTLLLFKRYINWYKYISIMLPNYKHPIVLRNNTTDITVFYQVFLANSYHIKPNEEPKVIIDCGANIGMSSVFFKNKYPNSMIIAIEPEISNFELLKRNTKMYNDIHCLHNGVWNTSTILEIKNTNCGNWGFMVEEVNYVNENTVTALSIEDIMDKFGINQIDILKIDIEGSEKELFEKKFENWLSKTKILIIELHDGLRIGASKAFFKSIVNYDFSMVRKNENLIFYFD